MEVQAKVYYGLKMMAKKFRKNGYVESIVVHLQNTPSFYVNYKKEEDRVNALIGLIHEEVVARVVTTEERNVNVSKSVTMKHDFKGDGKQEITKKRKTQRWLLSTFKDRKMNYMKSKIYLKK